MKTVYIWQGDGWGGNKLNWMYAPARETLVEGFKNLNVKIDTRIKCYDWKLIKPNSIFIWIGDYHAPKVPWNLFKRKKIYTIYYQSEPWNENKKWNFNAHEIWDYSLRNVNKIKKRVKESKIVRFVPPGYLESEKIIQKSSNDIKLVFFGDARWRPQYKHMKDIFNDTLINERNVWNKNAFNNFINKPYVSIFLNLHKHNNCLCVESVRMSQLLSAGALIISEKSDPLDENIFKDYVIFTDDYKNEYNKLINMSLQDRQEKADGILAKYMMDFSPRSIFERANIKEII